MVVLVAAIGLAVVQPFSTGPVGFDSASSVVYFQRLLAGQRLEAFVTTTPKPLLTAIYGLLYSLVPDWRVLSFATIGAFSLGVALVSRLALRVAGPAAAAFVVVGLVGLQLLQTELVY
ncbi:MAG TPA: hypothetical protein VMH24_03635, partial [Candidatus Sulfotelmatobacter sp.]|nr:hypothetical protein [Candidatus Sulfotelmatobacter sp.]